MDVAIIGLFLTQAHVGAYEAAWRVTALTMLFSRAIASTLFPQVSQWDADDVKERIESVISESIVPSMLFVIPAFFGNLVLSHKILGLAFGSEFTIASVVLIILSGEKVLQSVHIILGRALQGIDRPDLAAWATVVSIVLNFVLNIALVVTFGIIGAAVATALSFAVNTVLHFYFISQFLTIKIPYAEIGWCALSSSIMALLLVGIQTAISVNTLPQLLVLIIFGAIIYGGLVLIFQPLRVTIVSNMRAVLPVR
jgi:O-antigen/teichoic acid export membrane protein